MIMPDLNFEWNILNRKPFIPILFFLIDIVSTCENVPNNLHVIIFGIRIASSKEKILSKMKLYRLEKWNSFYSKSINDLFFDFNDQDGTFKNPMATKMQVE